MPVTTPIHPNDARILALGEKTSPFYDSKIHPFIYTFVHCVVKAIQQETTVPLGSLKGQFEIVQLVLHNYCFTWKQHLGHNDVVPCEQCLQPLSFKWLIYLEKKVDPTGQLGNGHCEKCLCPCRYPYADGSMPCPKNYGQCHLCDEIVCFDCGYGCVQNCANYDYEWWKE